MSSKLELWTNDSETEFAIISRSKLIISTAENINFTKKVDDTSYSIGDNYDWDRTIRKWISFYFSKKYSIDQTRQNQLSKIKFVPTTSKRNRARPTIKCNFCGLKFNDDDGRQDHERTWHLERL